MTAFFLQKVAPIHTIELVILPGRPHTPTVLKPAKRQLMITPTSVAEHAHAYGIPVVYVAAMRDLASYLTPQSQCIVCCFPRLLPAWICAYPTCNIHPSLLPALRGPDPLFYTARGDAPAGITLHQLTATFDTGAIYTQFVLDTATCYDEQSYIRCHAEAAATTINWQTIWQHPLRPQAEHGVSYAPLPCAHDYTIDPSWSCQRVRQFMQYTNLRAQPYWVPAIGRWVQSYAEAQYLQIPCSDGILT